MGANGTAALGWVIIRSCIMHHVGGWDARRACILWLRPFRVLRLKPRVNRYNWFRTFPEEWSNVSCRTYLVDRCQLFWLLGWLFKLLHDAVACIDTRQGGPGREDWEGGKGCGWGVVR